ncbi:8504_t:CDS:2 [Ambispora leptoticha]|uniref:Vacuolar protein-sorting-associated protein 25 n=1 Tax=Ambispora leptoticha TaxID=144679 RepID=A0A9N8VB25_9GLOM|nr:8504_t:CDS:2 [Ambispora leptoticha]
MASFKFPTIHKFPPFYSFQPTQSTWQHQVAHWSRIILLYFRHYRLYRLELSESLNSELFYNKTIKRRLNLETLQAIISEMVKEGTAEWDPPNKKISAIIYWRKPEEWATLIYNWVFDNGMTNSILTLYEIAHGEITEGLGIYAYQSVLLKALDVLVKRGQAQVFQGTSADDMGVKFLV